jgi:hypothetical protein
MFGPKHNLESVVKELAYGLEDGTVTLYPDEPTEADVKNFESMAIKSLAKFQRRWMAQLLVGNLFIILGLFVLLGPDIFYLGSEANAAGLRALWAISLTSCVVGAAIGFVLGLRSRERSVELKTFIRILKLADANTAKRLVLWEGARLRDRAMAR